ncbi:MAG: ribosome recycling factor [Holophagales bacterium]|nr:ribosome recycling factor [Holophagales bacterium]MXX59981.1 ribosome recycling factor [Holophagales bacterium]MYA06490.1 ribosome recycling factor [Holophagales bacterium]MYC10111.1 ribosome recycling factor [Holophagales bacterium]MYD21355.1 ribosome recycling factor [Holophagales bacterium]
MQELFLEMELKMKDGVDHLHAELKTLRTGRASTAMLDGVTVEYYGTPTPLNQLASLSVADATLLVAQPFDPTQIAAIERAILVADLGLNPSNDGRIVRIPVPPLTEERRREMVKRAHEIAERFRNTVRGVRREGNERLKQMEKAKEISQDDEHRGESEMQKLHDHYIAQVNLALANKEKDILEV